MIHRMRNLAITLALAAAVSAHADPARRPKGTVPAKAAAVAAPVLEPKAVEILKAMSTRLAAARTMSFTAVATYESPSQLGPPLAYSTLSRVALRRPDKLAVVSPGDGPASELYYDGKTLTAFAPAENLGAVADMPPTIDGMLKSAHELAAIYLPFTDLIVADPYGDVADHLTNAFYIGQSKVVGDTTTDMVAVAGGGVFAQFWIGADDKLPRMVRAVYASDPVRLRSQVALSEWVLDGEVGDDAFKSAKAAGATRIEFARPEPVKRPGAAPATAAKKKK
jgi:hypothetical protein